MRPSFLPITIALASLINGWTAPSAHAQQQPNVLMIVIDDLNDWVGCLGGHPQSRTPEIDKLAKRGFLFTNAHCNGPICNPSRVSLFTGVRPSTSGIYLNQHRFRSTGSSIKDAISLPQSLANSGYKTLGCGKLFHNSRSQDEFQTYGPAGGQGPLPRQKLNCPADQTGSRLWDWGVFPLQEDESYHDIATAHWASKQLSQPHARPLFLACGFYRPHVPLFAPQRFFDQHPLDQVQLPSILAGDRNDIPAFGLKLTDNPLPPSHKWFIESGNWDDAVQAYLACVSFTDNNVGTLIRALDSGPHADNTWIILFSDHGFFLGEKKRWAKQSLWERATRVPLIIVPPRSIRDDYARPGQQRPQPVELLSIYPTLMEVCQATAPAGQLEGKSLMPLLTQEDTRWPHLAVTTHDGNNHAVRDVRYRYIRYADGSEELYDLQDDPHEWHNLAGKPTHRAIIRRLGRAVPDQAAKPPGRSTTASP